MILMLWSQIGYETIVLLPAWLVEVLGDAMRMIGEYKIGDYHCHGDWQQPPVGAHMIVCVI